MARSTLSRRQMLRRAAGAAGGAALTARAAAETPPRPSAPEDPSKVPGERPRELGERSPFERPRRHVRKHQLSGDSETPLQELWGRMTPSDLHYERHHAGVPSIDPERYRLLVHGMVERPTVFTLADLKRFPAASRICFLECSGNGFPAYRNIVPELTPQAIDGLTSTSEWTGVPLATIFREVGIKPGAQWFLAESHDACLYARSIPIAKGWDDAMLVYAQNGEALRPEQGYPARLLLPGFEGSTNVKWIRRIEIGDEPFMTREETSKYTDPLPDCTARLFSLEMDAKSLIVFPAYPAVLPAPGAYEIRGLAWSGRGRITKVDVSVDGGRSYEPAALQEPVLPKCHTPFRYLWSWTGREAVIQSRAVDETGYVQPTLEDLRRARGDGTYYHMNSIRAWRILRDGRVVFGLRG